MTDTSSLSINQDGTPAAEDELLYGALAEHFLGFKNGMEFVFFVFVFNMYKNDIKKAIYALSKGETDQQVKIVNTFEGYQREVQDQIAAGTYDQRQHTVFCGDSHSMCFEYLGLNGLLGTGLNMFCRIQGATAYGLTNHASQTGARREMETLLQAPAGAPMVVLYMGEVDCRMTLWGVKEKRDSSIEEALGVCLANYRSFVSWLQSQGYDRIAVVAVHQPVWRDETIWTKNAAPYAETRDLTKAFNAGLVRMCDDLGCYHININDHLTDSQTGEPNDGFGAINGEHHLNPERVAPLFLEQLDKAREHFDDT